MYIIEKVQAIESYLHVCIWFYYTNREYLKENPINHKFLYFLQLLEIVFEKKVISVEDCQRIRNVLFLNGFSEKKKILDVHSVKEILTFFFQNLHSPRIECIENNKRISYPRIELKFYKDSSIRCGLDEWKKNKVFHEIPDFVCVSILRESDECMIDMEKKILLHENARFRISSILCVQENSYFTILWNGEKWYKFDDASIPALKKIEILSLKDDIKKYSIYILYKRIKS